MTTHISAKRMNEIASKAKMKKEDTAQNIREEAQKKVTDLYRDGWDFIFGPKKKAKKTEKTG